MKLQLALDFLDIAGATELLSGVSSYFDWVEAGTPMIKRYGADCIKTIKACVGSQTVVADMKTMDAGRWEAQLALSSGAQLVTVMASANDATITEVISTAREMNGQVIVDTLGVADPVARTLDIAELGAEFVCLHSGTDDRRLRRNTVDLPQLMESISRRSDIGIIVAGGVCASNIREILNHGPFAVVVGSAVTTAADPVSAAAALREEIQQC